MGKSIELVYDLDEKPRSLRDVAIYGFQWVVTLFYCVVWGYAIVGLGLGFTGEALAGYMATVVLMIGLSTLVQTYLGHRFAMVSGPNVIPSLAIIAALGVGGREYALMSFNAQAIAGIVVAALGAAGIIGYVSRVWSPLVLGSMVMMVGLSISGLGVSLIASQGPGWPFWVGLALSLAAGLVSIRGRGVISTVPTLIVVVAGYLIFIGAGRFDWGLVSQLPPVTLPRLFPFGSGMPPPGPHRHHDHRQPDGGAQPIRERDGLGCDSRPPRRGGEDEALLHHPGPRGDHPRGAPRRPRPRRLR